MYRRVWYECVSVISEFCTHFLFIFFLSVFQMKIIVLQSKTSPSRVSYPQQYGKTVARIVRICDAFNWNPRMNNSHNVFTTWLFIYYFSIYVSEIFKRISISVQSKKTRWDYIFSGVIFLYGIDAIISNNRFIMHIDYICIRYCAYWYFDYSRIQVRIYHSVWMLNTNLYWWNLYTFKR